MFLNRGGREGKRKRRRAGNDVILPMIPIYWEGSGKGKVALLCMGLKGYGTKKTDLQWI